MLRRVRRFEAGSQAGCCLVSILVAFFAIPCKSATIAPLEPEALIAGAEAVVHATAISSESHWNDGHTLVVTDVRFRVLEALKGNPSNFLTVRVPGGRIGKLLVEVPGLSGFVPEAEVVLALVRDRRGSLYVAGGPQGRWDVETDSRTGFKSVHGQTLARSAATGPAKTVAAESHESLSSLLRDLREVIRASSPGGR